MKRWLFKTAHPLSIQRLIFILFIFSFILGAFSKQWLAFAAPLAAPGVAVDFKHTEYNGSTDVQVSGMPSNIFVGTSYPFHLFFDNTGTTTGYGPFLDIIFPQTGADGNGLDLANDGVTFNHAQYLGQNINPPAQVFTFTFDDAKQEACIQHPYAVTNSGGPIRYCAGSLGPTPLPGDLVVSASVGDQLVVMLLPFGSYEPTQPEVQIDITADVSPQADPDVAMDITARGGFRFGGDALNNPLVDPTILSAWKTVPFSPIVVNMDKWSFSQYWEGERVTGPNWWYKYDLQADIAPNQQFIAPVMVDYLPDNLQFKKVEYSKEKGSTVAITPIETPAPGTPGGQASYLFPDVTGGAGTNDIEMRLDYYIPFRERSITPYVIDPDAGGAVPIYNQMSLNGQWMAYDTRDRVYAHTLTLNLVGDATGQVTTSPVGITCGKGETDCSQDYTQGTSVSLSAAVDSGYTAMWSGACAGASGNTCALAMSQNRDVTLTISPLRTLTVDVTGAANGQVTSAPLGITCGDGASTCSSALADGTAVTLSAAPHLHYNVVWGGACAAAVVNTCDLTLTGDQTASVTFEPVNKTLQVNLTGSDDGTINSAPAGILCGNGNSDCTFDFLEGTSVALTANPDPGFGIRWGGDCATASGLTCTLDLSSSKTASAEFNPLYGLTVDLTGGAHGGISASVGGIACGSGSTDCGEDILSGTTVTLSAQPDAGYDVLWSGDCVGAVQNICTLTMDAAKNAIAVIDTVAVGKHTLNLTLTGAANGQVTSIPVGISCGAGALDCFQVIDEGSSIGLTAAPLAHYQMSWGGDCVGTVGDTCNLTMDADKSAAVTFTPLSQILTVTLGDPTLGAITSNPAGISCGNGGTDCSAAYNEASVVALSAAPDAGYSTVWGGACASASGDTCSVTMSAASSVSVSWQSLTPTKTPTATRTPYGMPSPTPSKTPSPTLTPTSTSTPVGVFTPIPLTRDPGGHSPQSVGYEDRFWAKSLAIQDGMSVVGGAKFLPDALMQITLSFQVSDYFAFQNLIVQDTLPDGLRWYTDATHKPVLTIHDNPSTYDVSAEFGTGNIAVDETRISCLYPPDAGCTGGHGDGLTTDGTDGKTVITFDLSAELIAQAKDGKLVGGCLPSDPRASGTGGPDPICVDKGSDVYSDGKTEGTITLYAQVQEEFSDAAPSGDLSVDQGDVMSNSSFISGQILRYDTMAPEGTVTDGDGSTAQIAYGSLSKYIYAINGVIGYEGNPEFWKDGHPVISPGDRVTYELEYVTNSSDMEQFKIDDFLPSPIFLNSEITTLDMDGTKALRSDAVPAAGHAHLAADDTFYQYTIDVLGGDGLIPTIQHDTGNVVRFFYGSFDGSSNASRTVHLYFTITVRDDPVADGLFLTNQARSREGSTNSGERLANSIVQVEINSPMLNIQKGVVSFSGDASTVFAPTVVAYNPTPQSPASVPFLAPETSPGTCPRVDAAGWVLSSNEMGTVMGDLTHDHPLQSDAAYLDAGDKVTFAIVVENTGAGKSGAFDIRLKDTLDPRMEYVPGSICVSLGDGTVMSYGTDYVGDLFSPYIEFLDESTDVVGIVDSSTGFLPPYQWGLAPAPTPSAPGSVDNSGTGKNVILVTYDVVLKTTMEASEVLENTASLERYTSSDESTLNFVENLEDSATVTGNDPIVAKTLVSSELENAANSKTQLAIGEKAVYAVKVTLPEGTLSNAKIVDNLAEGLAFVDILSVSASPSGKILCGGDACTPTDFTPVITNEGATITLDLGTIVNEDTDNTSPDTLTVNYEVLALNRDTNQSAPHEQGPAYLSNTAVLSWEDIGGSPVSHSLPAVHADQNLSIIEPVLKIGKTVSIAGDTTPPIKGDAGDEIVYTLTVSHDTPSDTAAYDVKIQDVLPNRSGVGSLILDPLMAISCTSSSPLTSCAPGDLARTGSDGTSWTIGGDADGFDLGIGDTATITITGTLSSSSLRAGETFKNQAGVTWTSLDGDYSSNRSTHTTLEKSTERDASGGAAGLNNYTAVSEEVSAQANTPTIDKRVPSPAVHAVGAIVPYDILITLPEGLTQGLSVVDQLPDGMVYTGYQIITLAAGSGGILTKDFNGSVVAPAVSPSAPYSSGQDVTFAFADTSAAGDNDTQTNSFILRVNLQVLNLSANQAGVVLANGAQLSYTDPTTGNPLTVTDTPVNITLGEPVVTVLKNGPAGTPDAGDSLTYNVTLAGVSGANNTAAFDVRVLDVLPSANLTLTLGSVAVDLNGCALGPITNNSSGNTVDVTIPSIPAGCSGVVVQYVAVLKANTAPGFEVENQADVTWTSQSGTVTEERSGADGSAGTLNDYAASSSDSFTTLDVSSAAKSIAQTSETISSGDRLLIGEIVRYRLQARFPESTAVDFQLQDALPVGLTFLDDGSAKVAFVSSTAAKMHSTTLADSPWMVGDETSISGVVPAYVLPDAAVSTSSTADDDNYLNGTDVYFKMGDLTNEDNDDSLEYVIVEFNALVNNILTNQAGKTFSNSFSALVNGDERAVSSAVTAVAAEPTVSLTKVVTTPPLDSGDPAVYKITLTNTASGLNAAPAFDVRLLDPLGSYLDLVAGGDVAVTTKPAYATVSDSSSTITETVDLTVSRLNPGDSAEITITATLKDTVPVGLSLQNTGSVTYTSLPGGGSTGNSTGSITPGSSGASNGERSGADGVGGALNDYAGQGSASFTTSVPSVDKLTPSPAVYTLGEPITYNILATLPEGVTQGLAVVDDLPVGLAYVSHEVITSAAASGGLLTNDFDGSLPAPGVTAPGGSGGDLTLTFGSTTTNGDNDSADNRFLVRVVAQVLNISANQAGTVLGNTGRLSYTNPNNALPVTLTNGPENATVTEPLVTIDKTGPVGTLKAGDTLSYTVTLASSNAANTSIPYEVHFSDDLVSGLTLGTVNITDTCSGGWVDNSTASSVVIDIASMPLGCSLTVEYTADIGFGIAPGQVILNTGKVTWTSVSGTNAQERSGADGVGAGLNNFAAQDTHSFSVQPAVPEKTIATTSEGHTVLTSGSERLAIGEIVRYRAVVQLPTSVSTTLQILDRLPAGLQFLNDNTAKAAFVSDNNGACTPATMSSSALGTAPWICGSDPDIASIVPTYALPDANVSASASSNNDTYGDGVDVYFSLGTITNSDNDDNKEYLVVEYNAIVVNAAANVSARKLTNDYQILINGSVNSTSTSVDAYVAQPTLTIGKVVTTPPQDGGDSLRYTLTVQNTSSGDNAAAAFEVRVLDVLNTNLDLTNVNNVAATLPGYATLTNDSNPTSETADVTISRLNPGDLVTVTIDATVKSTAPSGFIVPNTATLTYTSLSGTGTASNGTGSVTPGGSGATTGERNGAGTSPNTYTGTSNASFTLSTPLLDKQNANPTTYAVGNTVTYDILVTLREGLTRGLQIEDDLPVGLAYSGYSIINSAAASGGLLTADYGGGALPAPVVTAPGGSGGDLTLAYGDSTNLPDGVATNDSFLVRVTAQVVNEAGNQKDKLMTNTARLKYTNPNTLVTVILTDTTGNITITEPVMSLTKSIKTMPVPIDANGSIVYQVIAANGSVANVSPAYNLNISDVLPTGLNLLSVTLSESPADCAVGETNDSVGNTLTVNAVTLPAGCSLTVEYTARITDSVSAGEKLDNTANANWTSMSGTVFGERTGADGIGGALNDYAAKSSATLTTATDTIAVDKTLLGATNRTIGDALTYNILVTLPEGTTRSVELVDEIPAGMIYTGYTLIKDSASSGGLLAADYAGTVAVASASPTTPPGTSGQDLTLTFGDVVTTGDDSPTNNSFLVRLTAQIRNESGNQAGTVLANTARLRYTYPTSGVTTVSDAPVNLTINEPAITTTKSILAVPTPLDAGGQIQYRVVLANTAGANVSSAYDVVMADVLDTALLRGTETLGDAPAGCAVGETLTAGGNDILLHVTEIPAGCSLSVDFTVTLKDAAKIGQHLVNNAATTWTSLSSTVSGERTGADGSGGALNDYASAGNVAFDVGTSAVAITKALSSAGTLTIGETASYNLLITLPEGTTPNLRIVDLLPNGLKYSAYTLIGTAASGGGLLAEDFAGTLPSPSVTPVPPGSSGQDVTFTFGDVIVTGDENINNNSFLIRVDAVIADESGNQHGNTLSNSAELRYTHSVDGEKTLTSGAAVITIQEPRISLVKDVSPLSGIKAGDVLTYTVTLTNANTTAYEVTIEDNMPGSVTYDTGSVGCTLTSANGTTSVISYAANLLRLGTWDVDAGGSVVCTYTATAQTNLSLDGAVGNTADADWSSLNGSATGERTYNDSPGITVDSTQDSDTASFSVDGLTFAKSDGGRTTAAIGEDVTYTLTQSGPTGTVKSLVVADSLPAGFMYTGNLVINGLPSGIIPSVSSPNDGSAPVTITWTFGDALKTLADATITFTARPANIAANQANGTTLTNQATLDYHKQDGSAAVQQTASDTLRLIEPALTVAKIISSAPTPVDAGGVITYSATITNPAGANAAAAYDVAFRDVLPSGLTLGTVSVTLNGGASGASRTVSANEVLYTISTIPVAGSVVIQYEVTLGDVSPEQTITNTAAITWTGLSGSSASERSGTDGEGGALNDYAAHADRSITTAGATISKALQATSLADTAGTSVTIGEILTYRLSILLPEGAISSLKVTDDLPAGLNFVPSSVSLVLTNFNGTVAAPVVTAPGGSGVNVEMLFGAITVTGDNDPANNTLVIDLQAQVVDEAGNVGYGTPTTLVNRGSIEINSGSPVTATPHNATVAEPHLSLTKSIIDPVGGQAAPGQVITFQLYVENTGLSTAYDVVIDDPLPTANYSNIVEDSTPAGFVFSTAAAPGKVIVRYSGSLIPGENRTFTFKARLDAIDPAEILTNTATITHETTLPGVDTLERDEPDVTDSADVSGFSIDLGITKDDQVPVGNTVLPGAAIIYKLAYSNAGNRTASGVKIVEVIPSGATYRAASSTAGWVCGAVNCQYTLGVLAGGASGTLDFAVLVNNPISAVHIDNSVSIDDDHANGGDSDSTNNSATDETPLGGGPDLTISKDDGTSITAPGATLTYTLIIANVGSRGATDVAITDRLPTTVEYISSSDGGVFDTVTRRVSWPLLNIDGGGATVNRTVTVKVNDTLPPGTTTITTDAAVQDDGTNGVDPTPENNADNDVDMIGAANKSILTTDQVDTTGNDVVIGEIATYEVTVSVPSASVDNLVLTDVLEPGLAFIRCVEIIAPAELTPVGKTFSDICDDVSVTSEPDPDTTSAPINLGRRAVFNFGTVNNTSTPLTPQAIIIHYEVVLLDTETNVSGTSLRNQAAWTWSGGSSSVVAAPVTVVEPHLTLINTVEPRNPIAGGEVTYTLMIAHRQDSGMVAYNAYLKNIIPAELSYVEDSLTFISGQEPNEMTFIEPRRLEVKWDRFENQRLLSALPGSVTASGDSVPTILQFRAALVSVKPGTPVVNVASVSYSSLPGDDVHGLSTHTGLGRERFYDPMTPAYADGRDDASISIPSDGDGSVEDGVFGAKKHPGAGEEELPATGFAPGRVSGLPPRLTGQMDAVLDGLRLEIPAINVNAELTGIPRKNGVWDLTWLGDKIGYLDGTTYPTMAGNTGLTGHVFNADGKPGVFVNLGRLQWGDQIVLHSGKMRYIYVVQETKLVSPQEISVLHHIDSFAWLTLLTCRDYNEKENSYAKRVVIQAILVEVKEN